MKWIGLKLESPSTPVGRSTLHAAPRGDSDSRQGSAAGRPGRVCSSADPKLERAR